MKTLCLIVPSFLVFVFVFTKVVDYIEVHLADKTTFQSQLYRPR